MNMISDNDHNFPGETSGAVFFCAVCNARNDTFIDPAQGTSHTYVEDCQVCCHPNILRIHFDDLSESWQIEAEKE